MADFVDMIRTAAGPSITSEDGMAAMQVALAAYESAVKQDSQSNSPISNLQSPVSTGFDRVEIELSTRCYLSKPVELVGAGPRAAPMPPYALRHPDQVRIVGVSDPDPIRGRMAEARPGRCPVFHHPGRNWWRPAWLGAGAIVATQDQMHQSQPSPPWRFGYPALQRSCWAVYTLEWQRALVRRRNAPTHPAICHVLRYAPAGASCTKSWNRASSADRHRRASMNVAIGTWRTASCGNAGATRGSSPMIHQPSAVTMDVSCGTWAAWSSARRRSVRSHYRLRASGRDPARLHRRLPHRGGNAPSAIGIYLDYDRTFPDAGG